jgi:hypothetical protein
MSGRITVQPVLLNSVALTAVGSFPVAPSAGVDAAGTGGSAFATAWGSNAGIQFQNNGLCFVWFYCGATPAGVVNILQGRKVAGALPPSTEFGGTISANTYGWLPPLSAHDFNQVDTSAWGGGSSPGGSSLGGAVGSSGQGLTCIDFTTTTTLSVRVYQINQVQP